MTGVVVPAITYTVHERRSEANGRTRVLIECPCCGTEVWAYVWSLCGSGKRCPGCGGVHGSIGTFPHPDDPGPWGAAP